MVEVIGATVTAERWPIALLRVSIRTGRCLSGDANRQRWTSPRFNLPAKTRPPPKEDTPQCAAAEPDNRAGPVPRDLAHADALGVRGGPAEPAQIDLLFGAWLRRPRLSRVLRREQPGWFPLWSPIHSILNSKRTDDAFVLALSERAGRCSARRHRGPIFPRP
jgi:hypothetical protein